MTATSKPGILAALHERAPRVFFARCAALAEQPDWAHLVLGQLRAHVPSKLAVGWLEEPPKQDVLFPWNGAFPEGLHILGDRTTHDAHPCHLALFQRWTHAAAVVAIKPLHPSWGHWAVEEVARIVRDAFRHDDPIQRLPPALHEHLARPGDRRPDVLLRGMIRSNLARRTPAYVLYEEPWPILDMSPRALEALVLRHLVNLCELLMEGTTSWRQLRMAHTDLVLIEAMIWCSANPNLSAAGLLQIMEELHDAATTRLLLSFFGEEVHDAQRAAA